MLKRYIAYLAAFACISVASSCTKPYINHGEKAMMVEASIGADEFPVVMLTWTLPVTEDKIFLNDEALARYVITYGAKVQLSDDMGNTVTLTGKINKRYPTQYIYTTAYMKGMKGHSYRLQVNYSGLEAVAETSIPEGECELENINFVPVDGDNYYIEADLKRSEPGLEGACFHSPEDGVSFYRMCYLGLCREDVSSLIVYKGIVSSMTGYNLHFEKGEEVNLRMSVVDSEAMKYYKDMESVVMGGHNAVFPVLFNISSNVKGEKVLGSFHGHNSKYYKLTVPNE